MRQHRTKVRTHAPEQHILPVFNKSLIASHNQQTAPTNNSQPHAPVMQRLGNRQLGKLMRQIDLQRKSPKDDKAGESTGPKRDLSLFNIYFNPTTREETALNHLIIYGYTHPQGPVADMPDSDFQTRLFKSAGELLGQMQNYESFDKMPGRLKAIVFALEKLNYDKIIDPQDAEWMAARSEGDPGIRSEHRPGSTSAYGPTAWKCNKFVADAYASTEGAGIRDKYPLTKGGGVWGPQANELASGAKLSNFPVREMSTLAADGIHIAEIAEYDDRGRIIAKYVLNGKVFKKLEKIKGAWVETGETRNPEELEPGHSADIGDIVAFKNVERNVSGHTGLNLGNDLFISAMNSTDGVGILSIQDHLNPAKWDQYSQVTFRRYGR